MFENFKAGWAAQGKHPGVPPRLVRGYQGAAQRVLARKVEIRLLTKTVATSESDVVPTAITVMNLPFILGGVWAAHTYGSKSTEYQAILDGLIHCARGNYAGAPEISLGCLFINDAERLLVHQDFSSDGYKGSMDEMVNWSVPREMAAAYMVKLRAESLGMLLSETEGPWTEEAMKRFANESGYFLATLSTTRVTPIKERAYELFTLGTLNEFRTMKG
jgi:hypothetical protein